MSRTITLKLPPQNALIRSCEVDPLPYYYRPIVGLAYRQRTNLGLKYLPEHCGKLLDVGYGSGLLMPTLARVADELHGVDIHPNFNKVTEALQKLGVKAKLSQADGRSLPYPENLFDVVISFSTLDYVSPVGAYIDEMLRVLKPGGKLIIGVPQANSTFNHIYQLVGFSGARVNDLHVTSPKDVKEYLQPLSLRWKQTGMPFWLPENLRIYHVFEIFKG